MDKCPECGKGMEEFILGFGKYHIYVCSNCDMSKRFVNERRAKELKEQGFEAVLNPMTEPIVLTPYEDFIDGLST